MSTAKKSLIGVGVGTAVLLATGGGGVLYGHQMGAPRVAAAESHAEELETELNSAREGFTRELAQVQSELADTQRRANMLEARRQLAVALDELDARNFGLAQRRCRAAARHLAEVAVDDETLGELSASLEGFRFELGGDFERSRQQLRRFARSLDRLVAPPAGDALDDEEIPLATPIAPAPAAEPAQGSEPVEEGAQPPTGTEEAPAPSDNGSP